MNIYSVGCGWGREKGGQREREKRRKRQRRGEVGRGKSKAASREEDKKRASSGQKLKISLPQRIGEGVGVAGLLKRQNNHYTIFLIPFIDKEAANSGPKTPPIIT